MLGCIQPMSSPMMNTMLGFDVVCAIALGDVSAVVEASAASAAPAVRVVRHKLIETSGIVCYPQPRMCSDLSRRAGSGSARLFGNIILHRYFDETKIIKNAYSPEDIKKFHDTMKIFKQYCGQYSFDYLMIAAQGYQESQLEQWRRSPYGAVGIMQILPSTAAAPPISIEGVASDAERNVHAGVAYMRYLVDTYISDPAIDEKNRTLMAFAAYN